MAAAPTLAETVVAALRRHGVTRMFGIPGGGSSLDLIDAAGAAGIEFVLTRTETAAAFMAAVTGELTAGPGVVLTGIGPGAASVVNGVAYAHLERAPLLLITDGPASSLHQAFDQQALFAPITKAQGRLRPENGAADIDKAIAIALTQPWGPVQLELTATDAMASVFGAAAGAPAEPVAKVDAKSLDRARELLAAARRPVLLAGLEARHGQSPAALRALADALLCPVLLTYKAKGVLPNAHPCAVGMVTGAAAEADCIGSADLIVCFGLDPVELIPGKWRYAAPVVDLRVAAGSELPVTPACRIVGPLGDTVAALSPSGVATAWTTAEIAALRDGMRKRITIRGHGHTADSVTAALATAAPMGTRLTVDAGAHMFSVFALWPAAEPFGVLKSNGLSSMGFALPAAIASALHEPERPVAAITGDGGLLMCLAELTTAVERGCRIVIVVVNDAALSLIDVKQQRQQRKSRGVRYPAVDFAGVAEALGCHAWRVGAGEPLKPTIEQAFAVDGPALVDVSVDPSGYGDQLAALRG